VSNATTTDTVAKWGGFGQHAIHFDADNGVIARPI
jgi:hypothetical protein